MCQMINIRIAKKFRYSLSLNNEVCAKSLIIRFRAERSRIINVVFQCYYWFLFRICFYLLGYTCVVRYHICCFVKVHLEFLDADIGHRLIFSFVISVLIIIFFFLRYFVFSNFIFFKDSWFHVLTHLSIFQEK